LRPYRREHNQLITNGQPELVDRVLPDERLGHRLGLAAINAHAVLRGREVVSLDRVIQRGNCAAPRIPLGSSIDARGLGLLLLLTEELVELALAHGSARSSKS